MENGVRTLIGVLAAGKKEIEDKRKDNLPFLKKSLEKIKPGDSVHITISTILFSLSNPIVLVTKVYGEYIICNDKHKFSKKTGKCLDRIIFPAFIDSVVQKK